MICPESQDQQEEEQTQAHASDSDPVTPHSPFLGNVRRDGAIKVDPFTSGLSTPGP